ncbi:MAG: AraC family transcriptional regulator [Lentisphaeria bacterium]|nr:AraC family transcriptional regulator [Lentisphaeria bacterium]
MRQRIERAKTYLSVVSNFSINEIAMHTGFSDRYSFSKAFKKMTGISPAAYRKSIKP